MHILFLTTLALFIKIYNIEHNFANVAITPYDKTFVHPLIGRR